MKKHVILITLLLLFASGYSFAQSTYLNPFPGHTHTYNVTVTDAGSDNPVRWYVTTDADGTVKATHGTDYTFVTSGYNSGTDQLEGTAVYEVDITWGTTVTAASNYYVYFEVDDETSGCTNRMDLHVQIAADFNALVYDVTGSATPGTIIPGPSDDITEETCPDDIINPLWDGDSHTDIGYSEIVYRVERQFSVLDWQFSYAISEGSAQSFTVDSIRFEDDANNVLTISGQTATTGGVAVNSSEDYVLAYVYITNQQGMTLDIDFTINSDVVNLEDSGANADSNSVDNVADHTILPMPVISNFGGN